MPRLRERAPGHAWAQWRVEQEMAQRAVNERCAAQVVIDQTWTENLRRWNAERDRALGLRDDGDPLGLWPRR